MSDDLDPRRRRTLYRAMHRGTKELDWLLGRFAAAQLAGMDETTLATFEALLAEPDPDLHQWIMAPATLTESGFAGAVAAIRDFHKLTEIAR